MRVLFVAEEFPPVVGGVGISSERVARGLSDLGCRVEVLTFDSSRPLTSRDYVISERHGEVGVNRVGPFFIRQRGLSLDQFPETSRANYRRRVFDQMERIARKFRPDVVLSFNAANAGLMATYLAREIAVPHVASIRGIDVGRSIFSFSELSVLRTIVEGSAHLVCVNEHLRRRLLVAFPGAKKKSSVIHNAVDLPRGLAAGRSRRYLPRHTRWKSSDPVAVFIGVPREKKGIAVLLRAIETAHTKTRVRLLIVGRGIPAGDLECGPLAQKLSKAGVVHVTGHLPRPQALEIAAEGDIVVMPSVDDGLANGLLEGMALGLCPVVSDIFSDVVKENAGYVVPRGDAAVLAEALVKCARDAGERARFAARSKARIKSHHLPAREARAYFDLLRSKAGRRSAASGSASVG